MGRFLFRSVISIIVTMVLVSILLFVMLDPRDGAVLVKILGIEATPEQQESLANQLALDTPIMTRYLDWVIGNDWRAERLIGSDVVLLEDPRTGDSSWWIDEGNERYIQYEVNTDGLMVPLVRQPAGEYIKEAPVDLWETDAEGNKFFWGLDAKGRGALWDDSGATEFISTQTGWQELAGAPVDYIPIRKGVLRGDAGISWRTSRSISNAVYLRAGNTFKLAGLAFVVVMPLALLFGIIAGINEGKFLDRFISIVGLIGTSTPEFVSGLVFILLFALTWSLFPSQSADLIGTGLKPKHYVLPVLTLTAVELGYVIRMTRASMVDVMKAPYIRTAIIKGMPYRRVVLRHALRNALMAPITIIMLHINYLVGGIVVVEAIFAYPGLGDYIFKSAVFGDIYALAAAAMVTVIVAVLTRLFGDLAYTLLNPRIRFS